MPPDEQSHNIYAYLGTLQRKAVEELYFPFRPTPQTWELHRLGCDRDADPDKLKRLKSLERSRIARQLVYQSGIKELWPEFLAELKKSLHFENGRTRRKIDKALLRTMRKHAQHTVDGLTDICRDALDSPALRLKKLLQAYDLERMDALLEYLSYRTRYSTSELIVNIGRINELHEIALESVRYHPAIAQLRAQALLYRLAYLAERAIFHEHHPIAEDP